MKGSQPRSLESIDPCIRRYPSSWRDAAIRFSWDDATNGVRCLRCAAVFSTLLELRMIEADHRVAWSLGGRTTWENLELLCKSCNCSKGGKRDTDNLTMT